MANEYCFIYWIWWIWFHLLCRVDLVVLSGQKVNSIEIKIGLSCKGITSEKQAGLCFVQCLCSWAGCFSPRVPFPSLVLPLSLRVPGGVFLAEEWPEYTVCHWAFKAHSKSRNLSVESSRQAIEWFIVMVPLCSEERRSCGRSPRPRAAFPTPAAKYLRVESTGAKADPACPCEEWLLQLREDKGEFLHET